MPTYLRVRPFEISGKDFRMNVIWEDMSRITVLGYSFVASETSILRAKEIVRYPFMRYLFLKKKKNPTFLYIQKILVKFILLSVNF